MIKSKLILCAFFILAIGAKAQVPNLEDADTSPNWVNINTWTPRNIVDVLFGKSTTAFVPSIENVWGIGTTNTNTSIWGANDLNRTFGAKKLAPFSTGIVFSTGVYEDRWSQGDAFTYYPGTYIVGLSGTTGANRENNFGWGWWAGLGTDVFSGTEVVNFSDGTVESYGGHDKCGIKFTLNGGIAGGTFTGTVILSSDEYSANVMLSGFADIARVKVNGTNVLKVNNADVSTRTVNHINNSSYYYVPHTENLKAPSGYGFEGNGWTKEITFTADVLPGNNTVEVYVVDGGDFTPPSSTGYNTNSNRSIDTWLIAKAGSFSFQASILAVDDNFGAVTPGGKTPSVFSNDVSSDGSVPTSLNTDVSLVDLGGLTGATINPDGTINIPANAAAGNYVLTYKMCSPKGQTTNCDTATVTLSIATSKCYNAPADNSSSVPVNHGVTILGRAGADNGNWPMIRNSAYTVLEGKTKGFVLTRNSNPEGTIVNPVVGMVVFDTDENSGKGCLKIYTGSGVGEGWKCFNTQTCP
ncbi:hypothetical protein PG593_00135 [Riemerella anatipestifer]|nr:hypothetical protein [Riemerella anatipestifer]